jgi:hypothetical protein
MPSDTGGFASTSRSRNWLLGLTSRNTKSRRR